ncbi:pyridoxal phosphate-dependent transferase [Dipodascopsis uninucleata]
MSRPSLCYFGAGPAILPIEVLEQASKDLVNYNESGLGLGEISHRSATGIAVVDSAKNNIRELLDIPDSHEVVFLQGGGTGLFAVALYNMLAAFAKKTGKKGKVDYIVTGSWSKKASDEAIRLGIDTNIVVDSRKANPAGKFVSIPDTSTWKFGNPEETAYVYYCDNETVDGVEFPSVPQIPEGVELVCDMSSNILTRKVNVSKYGMIFAGAQKNVGIAGVTICIVKRSLLDQPTSAELRALDIPLAPIVFDLPTVVKNNSLYNTLPIFNTHVISLTTKLLIESGGIEAQEKRTALKTEKLYNALDSAPEGIFNLPVERRSRSRMNIVFTISGEGREKQFLDGAKERGITGITGHRSVGGFRISNYNAVTEEAVDKLINWINEFVKTHS